MKKTILIMTFVLLLSVSFASAAMVLDNIYFDPAVVAAGDQVDVVVEFHNDFSSAEEDRINNPDYSFEVLLEADDSLTERYVTIQDAYGDDLRGAVFSGDYYNKKFAVKISQDAPAGDYEFKLSGRWYHLDELLPGEKYIRFDIPVKKEGVVLGVGSFVTAPAEVRPGDDYVMVTAMVENSGQKDAKAVELVLSSPEGIEPSYTSNNRVWVGYLAPGERKEAVFYVNLADDLEPAAYDLHFRADYMDVDNNKYQKSISLPFLVKPRPYLEVVSVDGSGLAGGDAKLKVTIRNTGSEDAESVDVRMVKQAAQPFSTDVRSDYLGVIAPGEESVAIFNLEVDRGAEVKAHDLKLIVRAKGDSDTGDDNIYTYNRNASFEVTGEAKNPFLVVGIIALVIVSLVIVFSVVRRK